MTALPEDPILAEWSTLTEGRDWRRHARSEEDARNYVAHCQRAKVGVQLFRRTRSVWEPVPLDGQPTPKADIAVPYLILHRLLTAAGYYQLEAVPGEEDDKLNDAMAWAERALGKQR